MSDIASIHAQLDALSVRRNDAQIRLYIFQTQHRQAKLARVYAPAAALDEARAAYHAAKAAEADARSELVNIDYQYAQLVHKLAALYLADPTQLDAFLNG